MDALQRLLIEHECRGLVLRAAECADQHRPADLAALFTADGRLQRPNAQPLIGREAIAAAYAQRPADRISRHMVTNCRVDVASADEARATTVVLLWFGSTNDAPGAKGRPAQGEQVVGEFADRFVATPEGWRIADRVASFLLFR